MFVAYQNVTYNRDAEEINIGNIESLGETSGTQAQNTNASMKPITQKPRLPNRKQPVELKDLMEYVKVKKACSPDHELKKDFEV